MALPSVGLAGPSSNIAAVAVFLAITALGVASTFIERGKLADKYTPRGTCYEGSIYLEGQGKISKLRLIFIDEKSERFATIPKKVDNSMIQINPTYNTLGVTWSSQFDNSGYIIPKIAYNYDLFFDSLFRYNLIDLHLSTDAYTNVNITSYEIEFIIPFCSDYYDMLIATKPKINRIIEVANHKVLITNIDVSYENLEIKVKGKKIY
jgi:hypothetical protein